MSSIRIGISGWRYEPWRGVFYPKGLVQRRELEFAGQNFPSVEINGSFYSLQRPENYKRWHDAVPDDFVFAVKGGRYITHMLRLKGAEKAVANFFASGLLNLREKLGPILWQLSPNFEFDPERIERFFDLLPRDTLALAKLARRHDDRLKGRVVLTPKVRMPLRHAMEIRHDSFRSEAFITLLRRHNIALVVADTAGKWPYVEDVRADFVYLRLHGDVEIYASGYTDRALDRWAQRIRCWSSGLEPDDAEKISQRAPHKRKARDVYCYFDNDAKVKAPFDALNLMRRLGLDKVNPKRDLTTETQRAQRKPKRKAKA